MRGGNNKKKRGGGEFFVWKIYTYPLFLILHFFLSFFLCFAIINYLNLSIILIRILEQHGKSGTESCLLFLYYCIFVHFSWFRVDDDTIAREEAGLGDDDAMEVELDPLTLLEMGMGDDVIQLEVGRRQRKKMRTQATYVV